MTSLNKILLFVSDYGREMMKLRIIVILLSALALFTRANDYNDAKYIDDEPDMSVGKICGIVFGSLFFSK